MKQIRPAELAAQLQAGALPVMLDVREAWEVTLCAIPGMRHIPLRELPAHLSELDKTAETIVICHHGIRSHHAGRFLESVGFENVINLSGGMAAWANEVDPTMARY